MPPNETKMKKNYRTNNNKPVVGRIGNMKSRNSEKTMGFG
jgi:hypothetical protein